jgi:hypothetical protein
MLELPQQQHWIIYNNMVNIQRLMQVQLQTMLEIGIILSRQGMCLPVTKERAEDVVDKLINR